MTASSVLTAHTAKLEHSPIELQSRTSPFNQVRHCEERKRRSNPDCISGEVWIASLALAKTPEIARAFP